MLKFSYRAAHKEGFEWDLQYDKPEFFAEYARILEKKRAHISRVAEIDDLPPVPKGE